jgi:hypothetical protein
MVDEYSGLLLYVNREIEYLLAVKCSLAISLSQSERRSSQTLGATKLERKNACLARPKSRLRECASEPLSRPVVATESGRVPES